MAKSPKTQLSSRSRVVLPAVSADSWTPLLAALKPLGAIAQTIGEICEHRAEIRRLWVEEVRIRKEATIRCWQIDAAAAIVRARIAQCVEMCSLLVGAARHQFAASQDDSQAIVDALRQVGELVGRTDLAPELLQAKLASMVALSHALESQGRLRLRVFERLLEATDRVLGRVPGVEWAEPGARRLCKE